MAQIVTITNPLTGQPAQVDQLDHTAQQIDDGIGFESTNYPGCYYRMVGGVVEWVTPPMQLGIEYRTTERYLGKPVYAMAVDCGATPNATTKDVIIKSSGVEELVFASFKLSSSQMLPFTWNNHNVVFNTAVYSNGEFRVFITSIDDMSKNTVTGIVKYTKTTD